ncbi:beta-L-arabinofuranosidase domain-containing protein [Streptomyces aureus]
MAGPEPPRHDPAHRRAAARRRKPRQPEPAPHRRAPAYRGRYPFLDTDLYKTLEGLAYEIGEGEVGAGVREFFEEAVGLLERVQAGDGYLNSFFQDPAAARKPWEDLAWGHELYNLGHLIQAAVAAHRRMGDDRLLTVARNFADLTVRRFGEGCEEESAGTPRWRWRWSSCTGRPASAPT